jgi:BlaI family transcriptional regulator, penicillinase repressor
MVRERVEPLAAAEWKVMRIVWRRKSCAARDVYQETAEEYGWAPSTAKTLLRRLVEKGYLQVKQIGNCFLYRPSEPAIKTLAGAADTLLSNALQGTVGPLLVHMVKSSNLSTDEFAQLKALLDKHSPKEK